MELTTMSTSSEKVDEMKQIVQGSVLILEQFEDLPECEFLVRDIDDDELVGIMFPGTEYEDHAEPTIDQVLKVVSNPTKEEQEAIEFEMRTRELWENNDDDELFKNWCKKNNKSECTLFNDWLLSDDKRDFGQWLGNCGKSKKYIDLMMESMTTEEIENHQNFNKFHHKD